MILLRICTLAIALGLGCTVALAQEPAVKGDLPVIDLTVNVERAPERTGRAPIEDRFTIDVALEAARKQLLDAQAENWQDAVLFLARDTVGRQKLEGIIIHFRMTDNVRWSTAFAVYASQVKVADVPDQMVAEYVADVELQNIGSGAVPAIMRIAEFGPRAKAALPTLEWIRSFSHDPVQVEAAEEAIHRISRGRLGRRMTGC